MAMDGHKILSSLTKFDECAIKDFDDQQSKQILDTVYSYLPDDVKNQIVENRNTLNVSNDFGWEYLHILLYCLKYLCNNELREERAVFTVNQLKVIKIATEVIACIGIKPFLLPQIKIHDITKGLKNFKLKSDDQSILQKYKKLSYTINILLECFNNTIFRPALVSQLHYLLAALLQLSHAPLKKPLEQKTSNNVTSSSDFVMTVQHYQQLKNEQESFCKKFHELMENLPQSLLIKELMVIMGIKNNPKWLQINIKHYLSNRIMLSNGIISLATAICDEVSDLGKSWDKLDITAQIVATSHGADTEKYYNSVSSQLLELFNTKNNKQACIIANSCIKALYDYHSEICLKKIIYVVMEPLFVKSKLLKEHSKLIKTEEEVNQCIDNLCNLFITMDAEFKCLPVKLLSVIALPLFYLYIKSYKSIYVLRKQVQKLILTMLADESIRETLFSVFLNHKEFKDNDFGAKLNFCFGVTGSFQVMLEQASIEHEELADGLFNLLKDTDLSFNLFTYLLKVLPNFDSGSEQIKKGILLETTTDVMERIEKQLVAIKLLTLLSNLSAVQEAQLKNPQPLLNFIKSFFSKIVSNSNISDTVSYEQDADILYTSLMFVKITITDGNIRDSWKTFQEFVTSIKQEFDFKNIPSHVISMFEEIETIIKNKGKSFAKNYYDLSTDNKKISDFDKALADLADPLLPVRAHGIVALTKLIERRHPEVDVKKDFILYILQENLEHDDSFIYLAAINGICAMSAVFPEKVIEILVQEFIGMTQKTRTHDIASETQAKLGEILVKTTRHLGEMTPKYKSLLVNGFLCGTRDSDALVRASSLSCLGEFCKIMGFRLGSLIIEILYCIGCIIKTDKDDGCRRAGVLVATLLLRGLGKDALNELGENLVSLYKSLKYLRDNDKDPILQLHAQTALEEFDDIVQKFLFAKPKFEKSIFLLPN